MTDDRLDVLHRFSMGGPKGVTDRPESYRLLAPLLLSLFLPCTAVQAVCMCSYYSYMVEYVW